MGYVSEMPLPQDLFTSYPSCPLNSTIDCLPESKTSYLSTHYELSRYDAVGPLRGAIHEFCHDPTAKDGHYGLIYKGKGVKQTGRMLPNTVLYTENLEVFQVMRIRSPYSRLVSCADQDMLDR